MKISLVVTPKEFLHLSSAMDKGGALWFVSSEVFQDRHLEGIYGNCFSFVSLLRVKADASFLLEIDLGIAEKVRVEGRSNQVPVTRDKIDALFDILGIFPRTEKGITDPTWS